MWKHLAVAAVVLAGFIALGTTAVAVDVAGLARASSAVVRARAVTSTARWTSDGARIVTDTELEVLEVWKGAAAARVVAMQPGGVVGEVGQAVAGVARFAVGEEVVLFLEPRGTRFTVTAMAQGKWRVERSSDGAAAYARQVADDGAELLDARNGQPVPRADKVLALDELKAQVRAAATSDQGSTSPGTSRPPLVPRAP